jgi:hypothetical protein
VELNRAATVLAAFDTDCAGAAAVFGDPVDAVTDDPAATVVAVGVGAVAAEPATTVVAERDGAVTDDPAATVVAERDGAVTDDPAATLVAERVGAVAAEPATTVLGDLAGAVTDVAAAGLETLAATGAGVALDLATLAVDACNWLAIPDEAAEIPLVSMLSFLRVRHLSVTQCVGRYLRFFRKVRLF